MPQNSIKASMKGESDVKLSKVLGLLLCLALVCASGAAAARSTGS